MPALLADSAIAALLTETPGWTRQEAEILREFTFATFREALAFVNSVGVLAEEADHHPDIDIRWNKVLLRLATHSVGGLTASDFRLAQAINSL